MASKLSETFSVLRKAPELIAPATLAPRRLKPLSDIDDQETLRNHPELMFFYKNNPSMIEKDPVKVIREALSRALVFYNPLAGRLREGFNRKLIVDCNNEGVLFTEADANFKLDQLGHPIQPPCPYSDQLRNNVSGSDAIIGCPLLLLQVTRLICGGFVLALRYNHTMCDAYGVVQFLNAMTELAKGADKPSLLPVWEREILNARESPQITCVHHEYDHDDTQDPPHASWLDPTNMEEKTFCFGPREIGALRNRLPPHLKNCSTFELIAACTWKSRMAVLEEVCGNDEIVRFFCAVNFRRKHYGVNIPAGYYGNAIATPAVCSKVVDLCERPLGYAVELVKKAKAKVNEEYIRSMADLMVIRGRPAISTKRIFGVTDNTRSGFEEVDFGWGKPVYGGPRRWNTPIAGCFLKYRNSNGENGVLVPMCMPPSSMMNFQQELKKMI